MPERRVKCRLCGEMTERPQTIYATPALAPGVNVPGARTQAWKVCATCASLFDDDDDDEA